MEYSEYISDQDEARAEREMQVVRHTADLIDRILSPRSEPDPELIRRMNRAKGRRGYIYCEKCGGETECVLDGEAWCKACERYQ